MTKLRLLLLLPLVFLPSAQTTSAPPMCSAAVHDSYRVLAPDGLYYPTWHPPIDVSGCVFDHDHGSNPEFALPGPRWKYPAIFPAFGYTAARHGMTEPHAGFKDYALTWDGISWLFTLHQGTSNAPGRACARYHTLDIRAVQNNEIVADLHLMADFGRSVFDRTSQPLTPPACPDQGSIGGDGARIMPVATDPVGYEAWRLGTSGTAVGLRTAMSAFWVGNPQTMCDTITCTASVPFTNVYGQGKGTWRTVNILAGFGITGVYSGTFYTDPMGMEPRVSSDLDAVRQYVKPGWSYVFAASLPTCRPITTDYLYECVPQVIDEYPYDRWPFAVGAN